MLDNNIDDQNIKVKTDDVFSKISKIHVAYERVDYLNITRRKGVIT